MTTFRRDGPKKTGSSSFQGRGSKRASTVFTRDSCADTLETDFEQDGCKPDPVLVGLPAPVVFVSRVGLPAPRVTVKKVGTGITGSVGLPAPQVTLMRDVVTPRPPGPTTRVGLPAPEVTLSVGTVVVARDTASFAAATTPGRVVFARDTARYAAAAGAGRVVVARDTATFAADLLDSRLVIARDSARVSTATSYTAAVAPRGFVSWNTVYEIVVGSDNAFVVENVRVVGGGTLIWRQGSGAWRTIPGSLPHSGSGTQGSLAPSILASRAGDGYDFQMNLPVQDRPTEHLTFGVRTPDGDYGMGTIIYAVKPIPLDEQERLVTEIPSSSTEPTGTFYWKEET